MSPEALEFTAIIVGAILILGVVIEATRIILDWQERRYEQRRYDRWHHKLSRHDDPD